MLGIAERLNWMEQTDIGRVTGYVYRGMREEEQMVGLDKPF